MMTLRVDPAAIRTYARDFIEHASDTDAMRRYASTYTALGWHEEGLINLVLRAHTAFADQVIHVLSHLHDLLTASHLELEKVAAFYQLSDRATAARLDGTYPSVPRPAPTSVITE